MEHLEEKVLDPEETKINNELPLPGSAELALDGLVDE